MRLDYLVYSVKNLLKRRMRSWLTVLSILIGIAAIFALVSFGQGISSYVDQIAEDMGRDKLLIQNKGTGAPGIGSDFFLTKDELDFVSKIKGIDEGAGMYVKAGEVKVDKERKYAFVMGIPFEGKSGELMRQIMTVDLHKGRWLEDDERNKVMLGYNFQVPDKIFERPVRLGDKIKINDQKFEVVGFPEEIGNPYDDANVYFSMEGWETLYPEEEDKLAAIALSSEEEVASVELAEKVQEKLRKRRGQDEGEEDFFVETFAQTIETFGTVLVIINGVLVLIALVSLIVAGVNIANTMYTSVLERTREIGVMKAIGARNKDIALIFIIESGLLGVGGGIIGVAIGYGIAKIGEFAAATAGYPSLKPIFPSWLVIGCIIFAFFAGAISGLLPAISAAKLKPVDALRYE